MPHEHLVTLLSTRFAPLDDPSEISIVTRPGSDEWIGQIKRFGIEYHTMRSCKAEAGPEFLRKERKRISLLKRKLVEQLDIPDKIFLRRDWSRSLSDMVNLSSALQAYAPHRLLWIDHTDRPEEIGTLETLRPGLLRGKYGHFWPDAAPSPAGLGIWLRLLNSALLAFDEATWRHLRRTGVDRNGAGAGEDISSGWFSAQRASAVPARHMPAPDPCMPVIQHTLLIDTTINDGAIFCCDSAKLRAGAIYVLSAWVWLPASFDGWVGLAFPGLAWIRMWSIDRARRDCWQRIVTSTRVPEGYGGFPGLVVQGSAGDAFLSTRCRLEPGVVPADCLGSG